MLLKPNSRIRVLKRLAERRLRAWRGGYVDWKPLLERSAAWQGVGKHPGPRPHVLIATTVGSHLPGTTLDSVLAVALKMRGARIDVLLCDETMPACLAADASWYPDLGRFARRGPQADLCADCFAPARQMYEAIGVRMQRVGDWLSDEDRQTARRVAAETPSVAAAALRHHGMSIGEHALAGALRFFARADLAEEPHGDAVLRRYLEAAMLAGLAARQLIHERRYAAVVLHHGIYVPQGVIAEAARLEGCRVVTWNPAYRKNCFVFSHGDTYHHTLLDEPVSTWEGLRLSEADEQALLGYLKSRAVGANDWIWFHDKPTFDAGTIYGELRLRPDLPTIGLLTNVMWDAQLHYPANVFSSMLEWLVQTVRYFERRPDLQLLIRIHPAEIRGTLPSRQLVETELRKAFPLLPPNVAVVKPENPLSTYTAMEACDSVLIYGTKAGVELATLGIPVIVAGEAWVRNKGITTDPRSKAEYFDLLDRLPSGKRMPEAQIARARKYAYHFFFKRMIPLEFMLPAPGWPPYRPDINDVSALMPGCSLGLDVICDGILEGSPFIFPAERGAALTNEAA
jgi:hypothetical protein